MLTTSSTQPTQKQPLHDRYWGDWGRRRDILLLWLVNRNGIWQWLLRPSLSCGIVRKHDHDLDAEDPLAQKDVAVSGIYILLNGVSRRNHVAVAELHRLGTLRAQLSGHGHGATLNTRKKGGQKSVSTLRVQVTHSRIPSAQTSTQLANSKMPLKLTFAPFSITNRSTP